MNQRGREGAGNAAGQVGPSRPEPGKQTLVAQPADSSEVGPGKRTLVEQLQGNHAYVLRKAADAPGAAPGHLGPIIARAKAGSGAPLPAELARRFEHQLRMDLSSVRIHTDAAAEQAAVALHANAFTVGNDIFFAAGRFEPGSQAGQRLLAHELSHVAQHAAGELGGGGLRMSDPADAVERAADQRADMLVAGQVAAGHAGAASSRSASVVARDNKTGGPPGAGIIALRTALDSHDADATLHAYQALSAAEKMQLRANRLLLDRVLVIVHAGDAVDVMLDLALPPAQALDAATLTLSDAGALARVVRDICRITQPRDLVAWAGRLKDRPKFCQAAILTPIVSTGSPESCGAALGSDDVVDLLQRTYPGQAPFTIMPMLDVASDQVLAAYNASAKARAWLGRSVQQLDVMIVGTLTCGPWARAMWTHRDGLLLLGCIALSRASWAQAIQDTLAMPTSDDIAALLPGSQLSIAILQLCAGVSVENTLMICRGLHYTAAQTISVAAQGNWLNAGNVQRFVSGEGATPATQHALATDPVVVGTLNKLGYPTEILTLLTVDHGLFMAAFKTSAPFKSWVTGDLVKWRTFIRTHNLFGDFYDALKTTDVLLILRLAQEDGPAWKVAVDSHGGYAALLAMVMPLWNQQDLAHGLWNLYGKDNPAGRTRQESLDTFHRLYMTRIVPAGSKDVQSGSWGVLTARTWIWEPVSPDDNAMQQLMLMVRTIPPNQVSAAPIAFVHQKRVHVRSRAPFTSNTWEPTSEIEELGTSYYLGSNVVVLAASAAGAVDMTPISNASDGNPKSVNARDPHTGSPLTYFQNHARHEIGHAVGDKVFQGMTESGDDHAKAWGSWKSTSEGDARSALWSGSGTNQIADAAGTMHEIDADDAAEYCLTLVGDGKEPSRNDVTRLAGLSIQQKLAALKAAPRWGSQPLVRYCDAVAAAIGYDAGSMPDNAFRYPGYVPGAGPVQVYLTRWDKWCSYSLEAYRALVSTHGYYSLASYSECFAEIYTRKYTDNVVPGQLNGKDWTTFFTQLEAAKDPVFGTAQSAAPGATPASRGDGAGAGAKESSGDASPRGDAPRLVSG